MPLVAQNNQQEGSPAGEEMLNQIVQWATIGQLIIAVIMGIFTVVTTLRWKPQLPITFSKRLAILLLAIATLFSPIYVIQWLSIWAADLFTSPTATIATVAIRAVLVAACGGTLWGVIWRQFLWHTLSNTLQQTAVEETRDE